MSHRRIVALALVAALSSLAACADSITAPGPGAITARSVSSLEGAALTTCRGGWVSSAGRC